METSYSLRRKAGIGLAFFFFLCLCCPCALFPQGFSLPVNVSNLPNQIDTLPSIAVDKDNHVHIAWNGFYAKSSAPDGVAADVFYTNNVLGTFSTPVMIPVSDHWYSRDVDIAVDSNGHAHIVFRRSPDQMNVTWDDDLYYVSNVGGSFGTPQRIVEGTLSASSVGTPYEPHILCDSQNHIHITFMASGARIVVMNNVSGQWSQPVIAFEGLASSVRTSLDKGDHLHIVFDGSPTIMDPSRIYYINKVSGAFSAPAAVSSTDHQSAMQPGIGIDSSGKAHIVYRAPFVRPGTPYIFYVNNVSGSFNRVIPIGDPGGFNTPSYIPAIAVDRSDVVHIAYKESPAYGGALNYGTNASGAFIFNACDSMGNYWYPGARYLALGPDSSPHFAFYDWVGDVYDSDTEIYYLTASHPVLPGKATLISPSGSVSVATPTFTWNAVVSATSYYLWVNNNGTPKIQTWYTAAQAGCASGTGTCSATPATVLVQGTGEWWIQTRNDVGDGPWSDKMSFTVSIGGLPGKATLTSPNGTISTPTPTYTWNAVANSTWYYLWVDNNGTTKIQTWYTAAQAGCASGTGTCSATPATALVPGTGQWWIETWNEAGYGPWSDAMSFAVSVSGLPGKATLTSPNGTISTPTPTYTWNAVANSTWYYLWVNNNGTPRIQAWYTAAQAGCASGTGTCSATPATALVLGTGQWWIQTWNDAGYGPWSDSMSFAVSVGGLQGNATLTSPNGAISSPTPTYTWDAVARSGVASVE